MMLAKVRKINPQIGLGLQQKYGTSWYDIVSRYQLQISSFAVLKLLTDQQPPAPTS